MAVGGTAVASQIIVMIQNLLMARWLGLEVNAYALATLNVVTISFVLVNWGFDHWLIQKISIDSKNSLDNFSLVTLSKFGFGLIVGTILFILLPQLRGEIYIPLYLFIILIDVLTDSLANTAYAYFLATNRFKMSSVILAISRSLRLLATITLIAFKVKNLSWFLTVRALCGLIILIYMWSILKPKVRRRKVKDIFSVAKQAWPFGVAEILNFFYDHADLTFLAFMTLNKFEISYYGVAFSLLFAGIGILLSLQHMLVPYIIHQSKANHNKSNRSLYLAPFLILIATGLIGTLFLRLFGQWLITFMMGQSYALAGVLIQLASPLILLKAINVGFSSILISRKQESLKLIPLTIVSILKAVALLLVYKPYGLEGMIVAFLGSELLLILLYFAQLIIHRKNYQMLSSPIPDIRSATE